jgi:ComF family protein
MPHPLRNLVSSLARTAGNLLEPLVVASQCAACEVEISRRRVFCTGCAATVVRAPPNAHAPYLYGGALATAIARWKYQDAWHLSEPLAALFSDWAAGKATANNWQARLHVVPVPLTHARLRIRGFNQAAALAATAATAIAGELHCDWLTRRGAATPQVGRGGVERRRGLAGAFVATGSCVGKRVLLIDDVRTTGTTLRAASHALTLAGADVVGSWTLALTAPP